jgi:hypothetical protein
VDGRVQKIRVDVSYVAGLLDYLDTTPAAAETPNLPAVGSAVGSSIDAVNDSEPEA